MIATVLGVEDEGVLSQLLPEATLSEAVDLLVRLVEAAAAVVVFVGAAIAFVRIVAAALRRSDDRTFVPIRFDLGRALLLGLEFQLAADVLKTAVAPTFTEIGQLAAIAAIRTVLSYFLNREVDEEREELARWRDMAEQSGQPPADSTPPPPVTG